MTDNSWMKDMIRHIEVSANLSREEINELGRIGPYHRYISFPVEIDVRDGYIWRPAEASAFFDVCTDYEEQRMVGEGCPNVNEN